MFLILTGLTWETTDSMKNTFGYHPDIRLHDISQDIRLIRSIYLIIGICVKVVSSLMISTTKIDMGVPVDDIELRMYRSYN